MKNVLDRFLEYVSVETTSNEASTNYPSTPGQLELGRRLVKELLEIGLSDAAQDEYGYVTATIPANRKGGPVLGLVTHLDTSNAVSGANIRPRLVKYQAVLLRHSSRYQGQHSPPSGKISGRRYCAE